MERSGMAGDLDIISLLASGLSLFVESLPLNV
jgi:hypothetical protein